MATTAQSIADIVRRQMADTQEPYRWTDPEFVYWISAGQRQMAAFRPDLFSKVAVVQLDVGTRQELPADGMSLLSVNRNMGTAGTTPRTAITAGRRQLLDSINPNWHMGSRCLDVTNYIYDPLDALAYYVYPPSNGQGRVEINYLYTPAMLAALSDNLVVPDAYTPSLFDYVMFRLHQKDAEEAAGQAVARMYFDSFVSGLGQSLTAKVESNPNLQMGEMAQAPLAQAR